MKKSNAFKKFLLSHERAMEMIRLCIKIVKDNPGQIDEKLDDLFRAAVVMAVAAMDAYFTDRYCEALMPYLRKYGMNSQLMSLFKDSGLTTLKAVEMFDTKQPKRILSNMVRRHLSKFVTQNFKKINELYKGIGFTHPIIHQAQIKTKRKMLQRSVEILIERRHKIVHNGDYNHHRKLNEINHRRILRRIIEIRKLVTACDEIVSDHKI